MCGKTPGQAQSPWVAPLWQFELPLWGISNGFSCNQSFALLGSQSTCGRSQGPSLCVHTSLGSDGFYWKGVWVQNIPWHDSLLTSEEPFWCTCGWGGLLTSEIRNVWSGQSPTFFLNCPALLALEFPSRGNECPIASPWVVVGERPIFSCLIVTIISSPQRSPCRQPSLLQC